MLKKIPEMANVVNLSKYIGLYYVLFLFNATDKMKESEDNIIEHLMARLPDKLR
jgi:hypothetical protein